METKDKTKRKVIIGSGAAAAVMVVIGFVIGDPSVLGNMFLIAVLVAVLPFFIFKYLKYMWIKGLERQFPNFVRDLSDSQRSGMSFAESVKISVKANYGRLSPEVQTMHNRLTWGVPFIRVLDMFHERVKDSKLISEALTIIKESYSSGGNIASTLDSIARDMVMLKETEAERVSIVKQHVLIMYGVYFMFLGISVTIIFVMVPMIGEQPSTGAPSLGFSFTNPCESIMVFPCDAFRAVSLFLEVPPGIANYYIALFFFVVVIQGFFSGLITGQLGENSVVAGTKHGMIMAFAGIGVFVFLAKAGLFPT